MNIEPATPAPASQDPLPAGKRQRAAALVDQITSPEGGDPRPKPNRRERRAQDAWLRRNAFSIPGRKARNLAIRKFEADPWRG